MTHRNLMLILLSLFLGAGSGGPAWAQAAEDTAIVHAVMFSRQGCPHCHDVIDNVLPPLYEQYGDQLQVLIIEVDSPEKSEALYAAAAVAGLPRNRVGVPLMLIGDRVLIGSLDIRNELPRLIEQHLPTGGLPFSSLSALDPFLPEGAVTVTLPPPPPAPSAILPKQPPAVAAGTPVVYALMFWMDGCPHCHDVMDYVLPPLQMQYGDQMYVHLIEIATMEQVDALYAAAEAAGLSRNQVGVPLMFVGDQVLIGRDEIQNDFPRLLAQYLPLGGLGFSTLTALAQFLPDLPDELAAEAPVVEPPAAGATAVPLPAAPVNEGAATFGEPAYDGFTLAIITLVGMVVALAYTAVRFWQARQGKPLPAAPGWLMTGLPLVALVGLGVAGYLAYIETQPVVPICGPVGDCQAVQQSEYAYLFGIPIGVIGVIGYVAILAAWLWGVVKNDNRAFLLLLGMTSFGVLFSIYLTYLEPFVIGAVCAWCLTSAVIMTALMLMSLSLVDEASLAPA